MNMRVTTAALALLAVSASALADVKLNDNFSVGGYAVGSYQKVSGSGTDHLDLDAVKTVFTGNFKPVTGVISLYYPYNNGSTTKSITVLDAYATVDVGQGYTVTAGNFLSYLGYEAFDAANMTQITYAAPTSAPLFTIPAYHTGVKLDYGSDASSWGVAVLDSVYNGPNIYKGDGELTDNVGMEGYYKYTGIKNLTLWSGFAYDSKGKTSLHPHTVLTLDFWAEYKASDKATVAAEVANFDGGDGAKGLSWLAELNYAFTEKTSCIFRVSGDNLDSTTKTSLATGDYTQYTICPTYTISKNYSVRAEYSYYKYSGGANSSFWGVQALFKF